VGDRCRRGGFLLGNLLEQIENVCHTVLCDPFRVFYSFSETQKGRQIPRGDPSRYVSFYAFQLSYTLYNKKYRVSNEIFDIFYNS
jgi:hypothetical protein